MKNKYNIPVLIDSDILGGNYIDHYNVFRTVMKKRRIITKRNDEFILFGIKLDILHK